MVSINDDRLTVVNCKNENKKKSQSRAGPSVSSSLSLPCCPALLNENIFKDANLAQQQEQQQQLSPPPPPPPPPEEITLREADLEGGAT